MASESTFDVNNWSPVYIGPTWQVGEDGKYAMPKYTLGWEIALWCAKHLVNDDGDPWKFTPEQFRFLCWLYAVDEDGRFTYIDGYLQRLKGWGKDPLAAAICIVELVGPCRFSHWHPLTGRPVATDNPVAHIQLAAVTKEQNANTMDLFPRMIPERTVKLFDFDLGIEKIRAMAGTRKLEIIASSARSQEGARPTFILMNEALALDTPVPTPSGWTTMGELHDGAQVFDEHGHVCNVTKAHPVQDGRRSFRVTFGEGDSVVASDGHWWNVKLANTPNCTYRHMTTLEMFAAGREFFLDDMHNDVDYPEANLPIDPYILGLWLGDGSSRQAEIACDERDIEELLETAHSAGYEYAWQSDDHHIRLSNGPKSAPGPKGVGLQAALRRSSLLQNKHIPAEYLVASRGQRLALLQGLMDSDGSIRPTGEARFNNADPGLMTGVRELLLSVGYKVNQPKWQTREHIAERAHWKPMGSLHFIAFQEVPVFRLSRKAACMRAGARPRRMRKIARIEEIASVPVRCITVDSPSHLFLCGKAFHPTRNTHHWVSSNGGHKMHSVITRNRAKSKGGQSRSLQITNAFLPGEDSIAERTRYAYDKSVTINPRTGRPLSSFNKRLFDSLEAPSDAPLDPDIIPLILLKIRGDAVWLDIPTILAFILDPVTSSAESRRFFYNQNHSDEETLLPPKVWDPRARDGSDDLHPKWELKRDDEIVLGFDGARSHDASALVAIRIKDQFVVPLGIWFDGWDGQRKITGTKDEDGRIRKWEVDFPLIDEMVQFAFKHFQVRAFFSDYHPWESYVDLWSNRYRDQLAVKAEPDHAVKYNMAATKHQEDIVHANERLMGAFIDGTFYHDGNLVMRRHVMCTRKKETQWGMGFTKDSRESDNHNDAWAATVLAFLAMTKYLEQGKKPKVHDGRVFMSGKAGQWVKPTRSLLSQVHRY